MSTLKNQITLCGNLVGTPELKTSKSGVNYTNFSLAVKVNEDKTLFFDCSAFNKIAEVISKYSSKGNRLIVEGSLDYTEASPDGKTKTRSYKILVDDVILDSRKQD